MWFKVTVAPDGAIRSCEQVAEFKENGDFVYYVEGSSAPAAIKAAQRLHKAERIRLADAKRFAEKRHKGLCTDCSEPRLPGRARCAKHLESINAVTRERKRLRRAGAPPRVPVKQRSEEELAALYDREREQMKLYRQRNPNTSRRAVLLEVRDAHLSKGAQFYVWLEEEIAKTYGDAQAAE